MISSKVHSEEQRINSYTQNCFIRAKQMRSLDDMKFLLDDQGEFLGMTKNEFLIYFMELSTKQLNLKFIHQINYGFSIDMFPGTEIIQFRYASLKYLNSTEFIETTFGSVAFPDEVILHYGLRFEKGKIIRIFSPNKMNSSESLSQYGLNISSN
jgi:hypothetical protein